MICPGAISRLFGFFVISFLAIARDVENGYWLSLGIFINVIGSFSVFHASFWPVELGFLVLLSLTSALCSFSVPDAASHRMIGLASLANLAIL